MFENSEVAREEAREQGPASQNSDLAQTAHRPEAKTEPREGSMHLREKRGRKKRKRKPQLLGGSGNW